MEKPNVENQAICTLQFHKEGCKPDNRSSFSLGRGNEGKSEEAGERRQKLEWEHSQTINKLTQDTKVVKELVREMESIFPEPPATFLLRNVQINLSKKRDVRKISTSMLKTILYT